MKATPENTFLDSKESLAELAAELHVSPRRLVTEIISRRRIVGQDNVRPGRRENFDHNDLIAVSRNSDKLAEKFGTVRSDSEGMSREWATELRNAMRKDPAAIAARKIIRAIPRDLDCVVTTKLGYAVVTINRVESVPDPDRIAAKLEFAKTRADRANLKLHIATLEAEKKTTFNRVPKELRERVESRAAVADKYNSRVAQLVKELAAARKGHSAGGLRYVKVADVRLSLKAQYMANRVAKIARLLPIRTDIHPIRELPTIHEVTGTSFVSGIESPDGAYLRYERAVEHAAELARLKEIGRIARAAEIAASVAAFDAQFKAELDAQRIAVNGAKRALAARTRRRESKIRNRR